MEASAKMARAPSSSSSSAAASVTAAATTPAGGHTHTTSDRSNRCRCVRRAAPVPPAQPIRAAAAFPHPP
eukprot:1190805-Prorocentrum_minimum.AAC.1